MNSNVSSSCRPRHFSHLLAVVLSLALGVAASVARAGSGPLPTIYIKADQVTAKVSPMLYGLMTEEINYCYEGGLYAELVVNRSFDYREDPNDQTAHYWHLVGDTNANSMSLDASQKLNDVRTRSLRLDAKQADATSPAGVANDGFWGIPVKPNTKYRASVYAKGGGGFTGPLTVALTSTDHKTVHAKGEIPKVSDSWQKYEVTLTTGSVAPSKENQLLITTSKPGTVWFGFVSLFPPTWNDRPNGNRIDLMQLLADMKPAFLRFPGGNYLEGRTIATRFDWKKTIGDITQRPGHINDAWRYWSTDGMGLLEFLEWCEDLHMQPVVGVYAGYSLNGQTVTPGPDLEPYVKEALEEIEYVTGDVSTTWGARRARDGHPAPFKLEYVEIGNEDNLGSGGRTYDARFSQYFDAIKAKYPSLKVISTCPSSTRIVTNRVPDVKDDHFYRNSMQMQSDATHYDSYDRNGPKIFVGEWATREGAPTPNMNAALGDSAWMSGMERNSDIVIMSAYAPLFVNVNPGGMQWTTDLIGYDTLTSFGSPAYYAQKMFSLYHGDVVLAASGENIPTREWTQPAARRGGGGDLAAAPRQVPTLFYVVTRETPTGTIYLKVVNTGDEAQPVRINFSGARIDALGQCVELTSNNRTNVNSIERPMNIAPVTSRLEGLSSDFTRTFPALSVTVLKLKSI